MIHYASVVALFIAIIAQLSPNSLPRLPIHVPTWVIHTVYTLLLIRWPVGPYLLNKLSRGTASVSSVSLRSIKGLRFTLRNLVKVECDRLGYSIHLFGKKANRRVGVTFEGLRIEILHVPKSRKVARQRDPSETQEASPLPHEAREISAKKAAPMLEWFKSIFPEQWVQDVDEASRAWIRYFFSLWVDFVLQVVPSIISSLLLQYTDVQVTVVELNRVNFTLSKASLGVVVNLEVVKELQMTEEQRKALRATQRMKAKSWKDRFAGSVSRTFQAAWKGRQGTASISLELEEFTIFNPNPPPVKRTRAESTVSADSGWVHFSDIEMDAPENAVVHIPGSTEFSAMCDFDPQNGRFAHQSARFKLELSEVTIFVDVLHALLNDIRSMIPPSTKQRTRSPSSPVNSMASFMSPPSSPTISPPSSPRMSPTRRFFSPPRIVKPPKQKENNFMLYFNSAGIDIPRFTLQYTSTRSREPIQYRSQIIGLNFGVKLSDPAHDEIHAKWLGRGGRPSLETCKAWFQFTDVIVHRDHNISSEDGMVRIVKTAGLDAQLLFHQFPAPILLKQTSDATESFIACEIDMESIEATETLTLIRKRLSRPSVPKEPRKQPVRLPEALLNPPKLYVDVRVGDVKGRVICDDEAAFPHDVGVDLQLDSAEFHIRSDYEHFKTPIRTSRSRTQATSESYPSLNFTINAAVHSPVVRIVQATLDEDLEAIARAKLGAPSHGGLEMVDNPIFVIEGFELSVTGNVLGKWDGDNVIIELSTLLTDARLIIDILHVELWTMSSLDILAHFAAQLKAAKAKSIRSSPLPYPSTTNILDDIPSGVQFHAAIGSVTVAATGKDINPDCTLDLYRGVLFSTRVMFRYANVVTSIHNARTRHRLKAAVLRDRLRLPEDILMQAFAYSNETDDPRAVSGLSEVVFSNTTVRRIIGTQYGVDESALSDPPINVGPNALSFSIPRIRIRSFLIRRPVHGSESLVDLVKVAVDVVLISAHIQLLDIYSILLAIQTGQRVLAIDRKPRKKTPVVTSPLTTPSSANRIGFEVTGKITSTQLVCLLPLSEVLHARLSMVSFSLTEEKKAELRWSSASVLVPSRMHHKDRQWEELGRLPGWRFTLSIDEKTGAPDIQLAGECARIRIPYGYVLSNTILSVTLAVKAVKHLVAIAPTGRYTQMPMPPAESEKVLPNIGIQIESLMFEATDSPLESRLNLAFRYNLMAQRVRLEHSDAFDAKVAKIEASTTKPNNSQLTNEWNFSKDSSIGEREARRRLRELFSSVWINQIDDAKASAMAREENMTMRFREGKTVPTTDAIPVSLYVPPSLPPLFRLSLNGVSVSIRSPGWTEDDRKAFMEDLGSGIPRKTEFTLLVPMHLDVAVDSARFVLRDLPLPLLNVPQSPDRKALVFNTDLVIGEEVGPDCSVRWVQCDVAGEHADAPGTAPFNMLIPKTNMPVKTYAQPEINVQTTGITDMAWGVSYLPVIQELMKVIDTLSTLPIDPSPTLGFWDKMRLILHWRIKVHFTGEVHVHLKGSRDAWKISGDAVGIALCARRNTRITIGYPNPENELVQLTSDDMLIVIPSLKHFENTPSGLSALDNEIESSNRQPQKVIAKLVNGVRIGMGFMFERACRSECPKCPADADAFHRSCRIFDFKPHYEVSLRADPADTGKDSFEGFRSDFIHLGISMHSPAGPTAGEITVPNSVHLTPRVFAHFWSWIRLFDDALALPIRQGKLWSVSRPPSEKFGRHLATLKYRFCLDNLSIAHTYKQDSQEFWASGEVPVVGVKAHVKSLRADLHQRAQEVRAQVQDGEGSSGVKTTRTKAFYGAELGIADLYMRAVLAIFREPYLQSVVPDSYSDYESPYTVAPPASTNDPVFDKDDYTELDWVGTDCSPKFFMGEVASCPQMSFVRKIEVVRQPLDDPLQGPAKMSKFGSEPSHDCLLGMEMDPRIVQLSMATARKKVLEEELADLATEEYTYEDKRAGLLQRIELLSTHIDKLQNPPPSSTPSRLDGLHGNWTEADWEHFENLYYVHAPKLSLTNGTRNLLLQYYYESRRRRGFEYHMASSAVRFIREHAMASETRKEDSPPNRAGQPSQTRIKSSNAVRRLFTRHQEPRKAQEPVAGPADVDANIGGFQDTETQSKHFCLLFKPQIVLRSNLDDESVIIIAANDAAIQSMNVMDKKVDDPVNGHILSKNYFILSGMQLFAPLPFCNSPATGIQLPFEGFLDDTCRTLEYDRIVMHTNMVVQYHKYNRLRLRTAAQSTPQSDLLLANIPKFTLEANSDHFLSLYNVVTDLLLYADPSNRSRLDRLAAFVMNDDISDSASTASEIASRQKRIRALSEQLNDFTLREGNMRPSELVEMYSISASIMAQVEELGLIFDAIQLVQDRDQVASAGKAGIRLETSSSELTWNLMNANATLLARLSIRYLDFLWISSQDGSSANRLKIKDLEAVDGRPNAKFPEMVSKQKKWLADNQMAKTGTLLEVVWTTAAPVGGISILTNFDLSFHPINVQFDVSVGHKIQTYIFPKDRSARYHSSTEGGDAEGERYPPDSPDVATSFHGHGEDAGIPPRASFDERQGRGLLRPALTLSRSSSHSDLGRATTKEIPRLRRARSNQNLGAAVKHAETGINAVATKPKVHDGVAEMRARSAEFRTFIQARINASGICLSFRRDKDLSVIIPDITDLYFETPEIVFGNRTCSFKDLLQEFKWELISRTGNVLLTSGGLKSFNFTGIKDRLLPGKRHIPSRSQFRSSFESSKPTNRQIGHSKERKPMIEPHSDTAVSSTAEGTTQSDSSINGGGESLDNANDTPTRVSTDTLPVRKSTSSNRRFGSIDSGPRGQYETGEESENMHGTPRRRLLSLLHRSGTSSPSMKSKPLSSGPSQSSQ